jgi:prophage antirepressor-like protein
LSLQRPTSPRKSAAVAQRRAAAAQVFHFIARTTDGSPFGTFKVRTVTLDGQPWFVAPDVCRALGLVDVSAACRPLADDECRRVTRRTNPNLFPSGRGYSRLLLVTEPGLYRLIMRSDKVAAEPFRQWVTREVLPAIRKDDAYIVGEEKVRTGEMTEAP